MCKNLLNKIVFLGLRNYLYTFHLSNSLPRGLCTFNWILHISLHRSGSLIEKLDFWNHAFFNFLMPFLAGRSLSAPKAFKNCFETAPFNKKWHFWDISSSSDFRLWRNKKWLKKLLCHCERMQWVNQNHIVTTPRTISEVASNNFFHSWDLSFGR